MRTPHPLALNLAVERFEIDAFARALGCYPTMTAIHASFFAGQAGEGFLDVWHEARDGPRPAYDAMHEDGLVWRVIGGRMGLDAWADEDGLPTRTHAFPVPGSFHEAVHRLRQTDAMWQELDQEVLGGAYRLECLKGPCAG